MGRFPVMWLKWSVLVGIVFSFIFFTSSVQAARLHEARPNYEIVINIPAFSLHLYEDGVLFKTFPIGVGRTVNPSQLGSTRIINNVAYPSYYPPDWYRRGLQPIAPGPDNPVGTRWLGLGFPGYGIHGTNDPASIGTAASAGCIRMYNDDVEELASYVQVGTSVTFVYETIRVDRDMLTGHPSVTIYKDIYKQGTNDVSRALQVLRQGGVDTASIDLGALHDLLQEASGKARPIPTSVPLYVNDQRVDFKAVDFGGRVLLPITKVADLLGVSTKIVLRDDEWELFVAGIRTEDVTWLGQQAYMPVEPAGRLLGILDLSVERNEVRLHQVHVVTDRGERLPLRTYVMGTWLLLPVDDLIYRAGVRATWDGTIKALRVGHHVLFGVEIIDERPFLAHDRWTEHFGLRIDWRPDNLIATLHEH